MDVGCSSRSATTAGYLDHCPQYMPTFELNKLNRPAAEHYGLDSPCDDQAAAASGQDGVLGPYLESFLYGRAGPRSPSASSSMPRFHRPTIPPAIWARMTSTID